MTDIDNLKVSLYRTFFIQMAVSPKDPLQAIAGKSAWDASIDGRINHKSLEFCEAAIQEAIDTKCDFGSRKFALKLLERGGFAFSRHFQELNLISRIKSNLHDPNHEIVELSEKVVKVATA